MASLSLAGDAGEETQDSANQFGVFNTTGAHPRRPAELQPTVYSRVHNLVLIQIGFVIAQQ